MMLTFTVPGWQAPADLACAASAPVAKAPSPAPVTAPVSASLPTLPAVVHVVLAALCAWAAVV